MDQQPCAPKCIVPYQPLFWVTLAFGDVESDEAFPLDGEQCEASVR